MIYVDKRQGSIELVVPLQTRGVSVEITTLEYADACFIGHGPGGHDVLVGIERKTIRDLLQSMTSGRLSGHQLPGLVQHYAYRWLLVEGRYRESADGFVEIPWKTGWETVRVTYSAVESFLLTVGLKAGVTVQRTYDLRGSAAWLALLHQWWTGKAWKEHRSHLALHQPSDQGLWSKPGLVHRMAAQLPGIDEKAAVVAQHFRTVSEMVQASEGAWRQIPGIGKVTAARVTAAMRDPKG